MCAYRIEYKRDTSNFSDIFLHLQICDSNFVPKLSSYVSIKDYSEKIYEKATRFEAWNDNKLVGLIACYVNKEENITFITNVSLMQEFQGKRIASKLLENVISFCKFENIKILRLEVYAINVKAISFYRKYGFEIIRGQDEKYLMELLFSTRNIVVSISCITYNHEKYIAKTIEGFLMQKTNFEYEILIHDDASTDNTGKIIREFEKKYPRIIKPIYQKENKYSKGIAISATYNFPRAQGKYIALCEGDDYWTDPYKLQKQIDCLASNKEYSLCFNAVKCILNNDINSYYIHVAPNFKKRKYYTVKDVIKYGGGFIITNSIIFRREVIENLPNWVKKSPVGDLPLTLLAGVYGNIVYLNKIMSVYRMNSSDTSWNTRMQNRNLRKKHHKNILLMWDEFDNWTKKKYHKYILRKKVKNIYNFYWETFKFRIKKTIGKQ